LSHFFFFISYVSYSQLNNKNLKSISNPKKRYQIKGKNKEVSKKKETSKLEAFVKRIKVFLLACVKKTLGVEVPSTFTKI